MFERIQARNRKLNYSKNPEKYDEYVCTLSPKYLEIAERELGETEEVRTRCLKEMREWIADNPNIISCRTDALFLLRFLRVRKFSVPAACEKLETYLYLHKKYPKWFQNISLDDEKIRGMFEDEYMTVLPEKDSKGRLICLLQAKNFDPKKYKPVDLFRTVELISQLMYDDEELQVGGLLMVFDDKALCFGHVTMWSLNDIREGFMYYTRAITVRYRAVYRVALPTMGRVLLEFVKSLMNAKIRKRVFLFKNFEDVQEIMNLDIFPKEYNEEGKFTCKEIMAEFSKVAEARKQEVLDQAQMSIKLDYKKDSNENV